MEEKSNILIVDDDESTCKTLTLIFGKKGYETVTAGTGQEALEKAEKRCFNLTLLDIKLPDIEGIKLIAPLKEINPDMVVIMITGHASIENAVQALNEGASAYIIKPLDIDQVLMMIGEALEKQSLIEDKREAEERLEHLNLVLHSIRKVNQLIVTEKDRDRLIQGACNNLIETRGYLNAWIALLDESGKYEASAEAGVGDDFKPILEMLKRGELTECGQRALKQSGVVVIEDPLSTCADCPLAEKYTGRGAMTIRLKHGGKVYGLLSVSIPAHIVESEEEQSLFEEIAGDIAFALHNMEMEEERKRAEEERDKLLYNLKERVKELNCLYGISRLVVEADKSLEEILLEILNLITPSWQYPEITCARIIFKESEFITENFSETEWKQSADIIVSGEKAGTVQVCYREGKPEIDEGPFLKEERELIEDLGRQLGAIIEHKQAEEALRESEERFRSLVETSSDWIWEVDKKGVYTYVSPRIKSILGYKPEEVLGKTPFDLMPAEEAKRVGDAFSLIIASQESFSALENTNLHKDGHPVVMETSGVPFLNADGTFGGYHGIDRDITERKRAEEALRQSEEKYRTLFDTIADAIYVIDQETGRILDVNTAATKMYGYDRDEWLKMKNVDVSAEPEKTSKATRKVPDHIPIRYHKKKDGTIFPVEMGLAAFMYKGRQTIIGTSRDITERAKAEEALRESEEQLRSITNTAKDAIIMMDDEGKISYWNPAAEEIFGYSAQEAIGKELHSLIVPEKYLDDFRKGFTEFKKTGKGAAIEKTVELEALKKDGTEIYVELSLSAIQHKGRWQAVGIVRDMSEKKQLEDQFRQAQKMEAVGRLAGGVAHDFNNLLTVISGNADLALMSLDPIDPLRRDLEQVKNASVRAANLTGQLLAFSRKQTIQPKVLDLNSIAQDMEKMLRRLIREDIELDIVLLPDLWSVKVDRGQVEQVIANLTVNARDAMPEGGELIIETANVVFDEALPSLEVEITPGDYVLLSVTDTGCGMTEELKSQIFDPFFTTKAEGEGTGLGLSTVFGVVKQNDGYITVDSEPGLGTSINIFLHRVEGEAEDLSHKAVLNGLPGGTEIILVVEDEDEVRSMAVRILERSGYKVKSARSGPDALRICEEMEKPFDLIITDIIMPMMRGTELVKLVQDKFWPEVKVLYVSGYVPDVIVQQEILDKNVPYLQKPFAPTDFALKVREVLDKY